LATALPPTIPTVLVVDDEPISRRVAYRTLSEQGCRVLEAGSAAETLDALGMMRRPVDLVLVDVVMPGTDGVELAEQIWAEFPDQRILFMSAYPAEVLAQRGLQDLRVLFLAKPYTRAELTAKVGEAMRRTAAGGRETPIESGRARGA
jgi:two-component system, cell cycle sensor histidine kinase and response regulator CckA